MEELKFEEIVKHDGILIRINTAEDYLDIVKKYIRYRKDNKTDFYDNSDAWESIISHEDAWERLASEMCGWREEYDCANFYLCFEDNCLYNYLCFDEYEDYDEYEYVSNPFKVELI